MKPLTQAERKIVYKACELVECRSRPSYVALELAAGHSLHWPYAPLTQRYRRFYRRETVAYWFDDGGTYDMTKERRILMLLLFAEAAGDI